ncbi:type II toxin-antitoxin system RelE/ParE family toxin [Anaerosporobacter sp.]|uniref:type II toxin-antitoxin system RelE/ParE family toxin n=1 Tax=Anaerosporobacter sp. TaxID=1872529 RepID=UPI00286F7949|nr:type II toxin-antitoxin system RelE/ParE family toxin [Anaerosporobacter sp.]
MDKFKIKLNSKAYKDIEEIFVYIAIDKLAPENAQGQTDRIWKALKTLEVFPQSHQDRIEGRYAGKGYKQLLIDNYIAIFRIDEKNKVVYVVAVQYQGCNI